MKSPQPRVLFFLFLVICISSCNQPVKQTTKETITQPAIDSNEYLLRIYDTDDEAIGWGYINLKGDTVIALGKYGMCFTDTFKTYAIVAKAGDIVAIDRQENVLYQVFAFDNGPDYPAEGLFRILVNNKIGYADEVTGKIIIQPQFDCAFPFENGIAQVSNNCKTEHQKERSTWISKHWEYIDKAGNKAATPKAATE